MAYELSNCIALGVHDMRAAADFYERVLGYRRRHTSPGFIEMHTGALRLFLCNQELVAPTFEMQVEDLPKAAAYLSSNGFEQEDEGEGEVYMRDPYGYVYCLTEKRLS